VIVGTVEVAARRGSLLGGGDADFAGDGGSRLRMIPGDHDHLDARVVAAGHGFLGRRARGIVHPGQTDKDEVGLHLFGGVIRGGRGLKIAMGGAQDP
jgi:hypothetical protein